MFPFRLNAYAPFCNGSAFKDCGAFIQLAFAMPQVIVPFSDK